jgi:energy-coupling factor transporter ATP-binding protein EcfA2
MIVKLAGNNGSGKTTLIRALMKLWRFVEVPVTQGKPKVLEYVASGIRAGDPLYGKFTKVVVLGDYRNVCGGMDTVSDKDVRYAMVEKWCADKKALVFFEGILMGETYGALGELSDSSKAPWVYAFMGTSWDDCVARVRARRLERGNDTPFDPERQMRKRVRRYGSVSARAVAAGHTVYTVPGDVKPDVAAKRLVKFLEGVK